MVKARLQAEYGDEMSTWEWSDEMRDAAIESITKTYESVLATTASPEEAYEAIKTEYLAIKRRAGKWLNTGCISIPTHEAGWSSVIKLYIIQCLLLL